MLNQMTITFPDDWHIHLRDNDALKTTVPHAAQSFKRVIVMPNTTPPVKNRQDAEAYYARIQKHIPEGSDFQPLMTLYLTPDTTPEIIEDAKASGIVHAVKLYPAGVTTNSTAGVSSLKNLYPVFEKMAEVSLPLLIHGEASDPEIDIFDRELTFIEQELKPLHAAIPTLRIVLEHITTKDAVEFVLSANDNVGATLTPQHLLFNRNSLLSGGIKPHLYCLPILKRETHRQALIEAATSGNPKFFIGTDSAPHAQSAKESSCGCAGCYSALTAVSHYAEAFERMNALDKLEAFLGHYGADFYGLPRNTETITLVREDWTPPESYPYLDNEYLIPLGAKQVLKWKVK